MSDPFLGEIKMMSFGFAPRGWALCNGQILAIAQNQALFSLLGTTYGGNGTTTFALPDFRGRTGLHIGSGIAQGLSSGEANHTLIINEIPSHPHTPLGDAGAANAGSPAGGTWAAQEASPYSTAINVAMNNTACGLTGGNQPHSNLSPYLTINFCIALIGIFPSRN